jgi:sugar phosphate isomerase/epimerase
MFSGGKMRISRREFVGGVAAFAALGFRNPMAMANPLGLPLAIQLYSVRDQMKDDLDGTLAGVSAAGFTVVEAAALPKKPAAEIRAALDKAGLKCVSAHHGFSDLHARFDEVVEYDKALGVKFIICASPGHRNAEGNAPMTLDDWKYNAEQFNEMGAKLASQGVRFGYHNHVGEFAMLEGRTPYFELLRWTDPVKVTFELDCGWAVVAGKKPVEILTSYPHRISMLHVKDFKLPATPTPGSHDAKVTELGQGNIDYRPIFAAAGRSQHIEYAFVEQEAFDMPWRDSLKVDAEYLRKL